MIVRLLRGAVGGIWGLLAMAGVSFTTRRLVEPLAPINPTHYEHVVAKVTQVASPETELDRATQIRFGEAAHLGAGAFWGVVLATILAGRQIKPVTHGLVSGTLLWVMAFGGYMPALGISKSLSQMDGYERGRTWVSHAVYAIVTLMALRAGQAD